MPDEYYYFDNAIELANQGDFKGSISVCSEGLKYYPESQPLYTRRANSYFFGLKDYKKAIADYTQAIKYAPDEKAKADIHIFRGSAYHKLDLEENTGVSANKAMADFNQAIKIAPNAASYYSYRGGEYAWLCEPEKAIADYEKAVELGYTEDDITKKLNGLKEMVQWGLGKSFMLLRRSAETKEQKTGDTKGAIADYTKLIAMMPEVKDKGEWYSRRAQLYNKLEQYKQALTDIKKAIEYNPNQAVYHLVLGNILAATEASNPNEAIQSYTKAINLDPNLDQAWMMRGCCYCDLGNFNEGIANMRKAIAINPNGADYQQTLQEAMAAAPRSSVPTSSAYNIVSKILFWIAIVLAALGLLGGIIGGSFFSGLFVGLLFGGIVLLIRFVVQKVWKALAK